MDSIIAGLCLGALMGVTIRLIRMVKEDRKPKPYQENATRAHRIQLLEHWNMIAGHEETCPDCIKAAEERDYKREIELAKQHAWDAAEKVEYAKVAADLMAAQRRGRLRLKPVLDPRWEWVEVTKFGETEPTWIKGRRIG